MLAYILRRLLLILPVLIGVMVVNFVIVQFAPGGPVEQLLAQLQGQAVGATERFSGGQGDFGGANQSQEASAGSSQVSNKYRGAQGLDPEIVKEIEKTFGFDKPAHERFLLMMGKYFTFDFGESYFRDRKVIDLVIEKMPVSISLGHLDHTARSISSPYPLGIKQGGSMDGSKFDVWTSGATVIVGYAIPSFLFADAAHRGLFAGGRYFDWSSRCAGWFRDDWENLSSVPAEALDYYVAHGALPVISMVDGWFRRR